MSVLQEVKQYDGKYYNDGTDICNCADEAKGVFSDTLGGTLQKGGDLVCYVRGCMNIGNIK